MRTWSIVKRIRTLGISTPFWISSIPSSPSPRSLNSSKPFGREVVYNICHFSTQDLLANPDQVSDEFGQSDLYFKLGYFSLIGLLRTHVLLGDYNQALKTVEQVEMDAKGLYNTVPSCLVTLHYFVGFSHMMMRNYAEATKMFVNCLLFIQRTKSLQAQQQKKNFQYDVVGSFLP